MLQIEKKFTTIRFMKCYHVQGWIHRKQYGLRMGPGYLQQSSPGSQGAKRCRSQTISQEGAARNELVQPQTFLAPACLGESFQ